jgi:RHH-type rel operon transcriptional repressor/antitoxin RelB
VYVIDIQTYKRLHIPLTTSILLVDTMRAVILVRHPEQLALGTDDIALETEQARSFHIQKEVGMYIRKYADLQIALDRLNDPADRVISLQEMRTKITAPQMA